MARALAVAHTSIYDAWAAYDSKAVGTRLGGSLRRPAEERTLANINQAISFAAYRAAIDLFPSSAASIFDPLMLSLGYEPADGSTDPSTPSGIGNIAARAVLEFRHRDGANQLGYEPGGVPEDAADRGGAPRLSGGKTRACATALRAAGRRTVAPWLGARVGEGGSEYNEEMQQPPLQRLVFARA